MKTIKKSKFSKLLSIVMSILLVQGFYSCSSDDNSALSNAELSALKGEEIFKGIFFLEGNLPSQVKFLRKKLEVANEINMTEDVSKAKSQIIEEIILGIKDVSPSYFSDLKKSFNSKNNYALNDNIKKGADLLYVGLLKSEKMTELTPEFKKLFEKLDMENYDFQDKAELNKFLNDVNSLAASDDEIQAIFVAAIIAVVAVIAAVTVAVGVSWIGAVQVGGYFLAWVKTIGPKTLNDENSIINDFDSELLTRDLINVIQ